MVQYNNMDIIIINIKLCHPLLKHILIFFPKHVLMMPLFCCIFPTALIVLIVRNNLFIMFMACSLSAPPCWHKHFIKAGIFLYFIYCPSLPIPSKHLQE